MSKAKNMSSNIRKKTRMPTLTIFFLFIAAPVAYGSSQARGRIRAAAASLRHSQAILDPSLICDQHHSLQQCQILNPLSKGGVEPVSSWMLIRFISTEP